MIGTLSVLAAVLVAPPPAGEVIEGNVFTGCEHDTQYDKGVALGRPR